MEELKAGAKAIGFILLLLFIGLLGYSIGEDPGTLESFYPGATYQLVDCATRVQRAFFKEKKDTTSIKFDCKSLPIGQFYIITDNHQLVPR